jgi:ligand-binding sensor domain-containing protein
VLSLYVDRGGRVWAGTADGLHAVAANAETRKVWPTAEGYTPPGTPQVQAIEGDESGRLWLAVFPFGLIVFDPATGKSQQLASDPRLHGTLREDTIRVLMRDRSGLLWLGGIVHGVANLDPEGAKFQYLLDESASRSFVDTNNVRALYEDEAGALWLATEGDGLKRYDLKSGRFEYFGAVLGQALGLDQEPREFRVFALAGAGKGRLWVASNRGVFLLEPQARRATALPLARDGVPGLTDPVVRSILVARDGALWFGGMTSGLTRYDPARGEFRNYRAMADEPRSLWHNAVHALLQDRTGRIWIGTFDGLNVLEPGGDLPRRIAKSGADPQSLAGDVIRSIHEASDGTLWFGSHNGLSRLESLDAEGAKFKRYLASDGLPNATVYAIQGDARGTLWLSGNRGIVSFDREHDRFQAFSLEDGLQGLEFNGGAALRLSDGRLAFGGTQGVNLFAPERITRSSYMPELAFTGYQVGNQRHPVPDPEAFGRLAMEQRERIVGFQFAAFDFAAPQRNRFQYQLEGFDKRWLELGNRHELQFTNLDPGATRCACAAATAIRCRARTSSCSRSRSRRHGGPRRR